MRVFRVLRVRVLGFWGSGMRVLGLRVFRVEGFRVLGFWGSGMGCF